MLWRAKSAQARWALDHRHTEPMKDRLAPLDLPDQSERMTKTRGRRPFRAYGRSKFPDMLWGLELNRRLAPRGIPVMLAHPGWALKALRGAPTLLARSPEAADPQLARRLWDEAVQLTGTDLD